MLSRGFSMRLMLSGCLFVLVACESPDDEIEQGYGDEDVSSRAAVIGTYQAEEHTLQKGCSKKSEHRGYTGSGFMDYGGNGSMVEWDNIKASVAGQYKMTFRYANGSGGDRRCSVTVNDKNVVGNVAFSRTGAWTTWKTATITLPLRSGNNKIRVTAITGSGGPNLDKIDLMSEEGSGGVDAGRCVEVAENKSATLACPSGQVITKIGFASYGLPSGSCSFGFSTGTCHASTSKTKMQSLCQNKRSCSVGANNDTFGDPCRGTRKKLAIQYSCSSNGGGGGGERDNGSWELDNGVLHVKFDPNAGGSIGYISESGKNYNVVNIHDKGRYIQQSYYAGQDMNRIRSGQHPTFSPWPWNPIQAGDIYNNKSIVLERFNNGTTIYIKTRPMLWDMNGEYAECAFETWATLKGTAIQIKNRLTSHRKDNLWTKVIPKHQELPAVYTIGDLSNLYTYDGDKPWTNDTLTKIENSGPPWKYWETSENWAAFVHDGKWGLGVHNKSCTLFVGGFHGVHSGGPTDVSTGYISPLSTEALDKESVFEYEYDLILGNLSTIRSYVYGVH